MGVFKEVWRVLRDDGTVWLNLGDSYVGGGRGLSQTNTAFLGKGTAIAQGSISRTGSIAGLKPKDLVGIPWRVAFALQADGWYLRSDIIWSKPNPTPESVTDRPTKAHEYLFLLSKSQKYFYDADAISEPAIRAGQWNNANPQNSAYSMSRVVQVPERRNRRTVWSIPTQPTPEAHFAAFPEALVEPCILAGSAPGDLVLDPFGGTGTTVNVAQRLGRKGVALEISTEYCRMAHDKTWQSSRQIQMTEISS